MIKSVLLTKSSIRGEPGRCAAATDSDQEAARLADMGKLLQRWTWITPGLLLPTQAPALTR
jgi:hypothetical protein